MLEDDQQDDAATPAEPSAHEANVNKKRREAAAEAGKSSEKGADAAAKPAGSGNDALGVDATGAASDASGRGSEDGIVDQAGEFVSENKNGLMAGMGAALMVGLIATAMGGGGIVALILGLLAMIMVGSIVGSMKDENSVAAPLVDGARDRLKGLGQSKQLDATPGHENAIDVSEDNVELTRKNKQGETEYLVGKDENGQPVYDNVKPKDSIELRTIGEDGKPTALLKGKYTADGNFAIQEAAAPVSADGIQMTGLKSTHASLQIDEGKINLSHEKMDLVRSAMRQAKEEYIKEDSIQLERGRIPVAEGEARHVTAVVGTQTSDEKTYDVVARGRLADGKASFQDVVLRDKATGELLKNIDNDDPIAVELPSQVMKDVAVEGGVATPMRGDRQQAADLGTQVLQRSQEQRDARSAANQKELEGIQSDLKEMDPQEARGYIKEKWEEKLQEAGMDKRHEAAKMAEEVTQYYDRQKFRGRDADTVAAVIAGQLPENVDKDKVRDFAANTHETFGNAMKDSAGEDSQTKVMDDLLQEADKAALESSKDLVQNMREYGGESVSPVGPGGSGGRGLV